MDLDAVTFPALIIADDGWVMYLQQREELALWKRSAIKKYNRRLVVFYDSNNRVWELESVSPVQPAGLYARVLARKIRVELSLRPIVEAPFQVVLNVLRKAIDADDDILTQWTEANNLKESAQKVSKFQTLVNILKAQRAI